MDDLVIKSRESVWAQSV